MDLVSDVGDRSANCARMQQLMVCLEVAFSLVSKHPSMHHPLQKNRYRSPVHSRRRGEKGRVAESDVLVLRELSATQSVGFDIINNCWGRRMHMCQRPWHTTKTL